MSYVKKSKVAPFDTCYGEAHSSMKSYLSKSQNLATHFRTHVSNGEIRGDSILERLEIPHDFQQFRMVLLDPHQKM